ncbi:ABC transporter [Paenibacillus apiarius]|uniref:ABC transporter n=1 Tax=Paenibacillus apiarius TaxID=46240 RepID=UPI003B39FCB2
MNMIFTEVGESIRRSRTASYFILFQIILLFFLVTILFLNYASLDRKTDQAQMLSSLNRYQLSDTLYNDGELRKLMSQPSFLTILKGFYTNLEENLDEKYIYAFTQPAKLLNYEDGNKEIFRSYYEEGKRIKPSMIDNIGPYYSIKAIQMNKQAIDHFQITVMDGQPFDIEDFKNVNSKNIPVLLGYEYKNMYQVGDVIKGKYLFEDFNFHVKGFVRVNSLVTTARRAELYLDRYIIMPAQHFIQFPADNASFKFQQKHYLQLVNGEIHSSNNGYVVRNKFEAIKKDSGFFDTQLLGANNPTYDLVFAAINEHTGLLSLIAAAVFIVCAISIFILMADKAVENFKNFSVHFISGANMKHIFTYFLAEILVMAGLPGMAAIVFYKLLIDVHFAWYLILMTGCMIAIVLFTIIPVFAKLKKLEISMFLKRAG